MGTPWPRRCISLMPRFSAPRADGALEAPPPSAADWACLLGRLLSAGPLSLSVGCELWGAPNSEGITNESP